MRKLPDKHLQPWSLSFTAFKRFSASAFTLAELLIALAILGVIATFTIPKILQAQQDSRFNAIGKETAATIAGAYSTYRQSTVPASGMQPSALKPYMNYVSLDTSGLVIDEQNNDPSPNMACDASKPCLHLHNGAVLMFGDWTTFGGTASTNAVVFYLDPDGKVTDGTTNGPGRSAELWLYYNGRITSTDGLSPSTWSSGGLIGGPYPSNTPSWFHWN